LLLGEKPKRMTNVKMTDDANVIRGALTVKILRQFQNSWKDVARSLVV